MYQQLSEPELNQILQSLISQSRVYCYFAQFECFFVHCSEIFGWSVSLGDQIIQPSAFLCVQKDSLSSSTRVAMKKKILYSIVSNPGVSLVGVEGRNERKDRLAKLFNGVFQMELLSLCSEVCKEFNVACYQIKRKKEVSLEDDVFEEEEEDVMCPISL